jgi:nucleoside-diphosphate-sugar epimerase
VTNHLSDREQGKATLLVTGAGGFVGRALCRGLAERGHHVRAAVRRDPGNSPLATETVPIGTVDSKTDWSRALAGVDVVIHLAARVHMMKESAADPMRAFRATNVEMTEALALSAARLGVKRFVYASSIKVNGEGTVDEPFTATDEPGPKDPYAVSKWEAEKVLRRIARETGLAVSFVRPPLGYGPDVRGNFLRLLRLVQREMPLPLGALRNRRSMIYNDNLADALIACALHPAAVGKTYLVSDGEDLSTPDLIGQLAIGMGKRARLWRVPPAALELAGRLSGKRKEVQRLTGSLVVDSSPIQRELGWRPPIGVEEGLRRTIRWFIAAANSGNS